MKILLDSHLLIWLIAVSDRFPVEAKTLIRDPANLIFFSSASIWELTIKFSSGRKDLTLPPAILHRSLLDNGFNELSVTSAHALGVGNLSHLHKDPFDRILIAQATVEGMLLLTSDAAITRYPGPIRLVH